MRFKPKDDIERIYETLNDNHSFGKVNRVEIQKKVKTFNANALKQKLKQKEIEKQANINFSFIIHYLEV